jgi:hypothetical protein
MSVEYQGKGNPIDIKIPKEHYICGNHLLSAAYIAQYLDMNGYDGAYCDNYTLKIIDNNVCIFELFSNQYVEIQEKSYLIK